MENISLLIVTDDKEYGRALSRAILYLCSRVLIRLAEKEEFFEKVREAGEVAVLDSADMILWDGQEAEQVYGGKIVLLSEKPSMAVRNPGEKKFCIYKYSQAQVIVAALMEIYGSLAEKRSVNICRRQTSLLAFASCSGGCGCTVLAMAAAQELCRFTGKRVLYISFEEAESTGDFMICPPGIKGVGMYLYYLFKNETATLRSGKSSERQLPDMDSYIVKDDFGLEAFAPTGGRNPLKELSAGEVEAFIASVIDSGGYDVIVMDLGTGLSDGEIACIDMAEKICFVSGPASGRAREEQYLQHLICRCGEDVTERMIKTENMVTDKAADTGSQEELGAMMKAVVRIERSSSFLQRGEVKRIFLDGRFGEGIKLLTEKMMGYEQTPIDKRTKEA